MGTALTASTMTEGMNLTTADGLHGRSNQATKANDLAQPAARYAEAAQD
jgi:hypothetical protein